MQKEEGEVSSPMMDPWSIFLYGMKAPMTREKYRGRLAKFFDFIGLTGGTVEERTKTFTEKGKKGPDWVFVSILRFVQAQTERVEKITRIFMIRQCFAGGNVSGSWIFIF